MALLGTISIKNIESVVAGLEDYSDEVKQEVSFEMEASCITIVANAKIAAAKDQGVLARGISYVKKSMFNFEIISAADYSAFQEFGTKSQVSIPAGFESLAAQFKGVKVNSGGLTLADAIQAWAKRVGIEGIDVVWVYLKILKKGIKPHPFLIPAYIKETINLEKRLRILLES